MIGPSRGILLAGALALGAAAWAEERPAWLTDATASYPKADYITGIGDGATQDRAADKARAEIAKSLSLSLAAETSVTAREGTSTGFSQDVSDEVRTSAARVLDGVEIAKYWRDDTGTSYALAVLQRGRSLSILKDKIDEYDRNFKDWSEQLGNADGKFARLRYALKLLQLVKSRRRLNGDYRTLNPDGKGIPPPDGFSQVQEQARKAASAITLQVAASGDKAQSVASGIIDALSSHGLRVVEKGDTQADIVVEAKASGQPLPIQDLTWFYAKGSILVKMSYGATGEVFTRFEESGQESTGDPNTCVDATLSALSTRTAAHVYKVVLSGQLQDD